MHLLAASACFIICRQAKLDDLRAHQRAYSEEFLPLTRVPPYEKLSVEELLASLYLLVWIRTQQHEEEQNNKCNCYY